jgi:hypothetical protein
VPTVRDFSNFYVRTISFVRNLSENSVKIFDTNVCYFADIHKFREFYYLTEYVKIQNYGAGGTTRQNSNRLIFNLLEFIFLPTPKFGGILVATSIPL